MTLNLNQQSKEYIDAKVKEKNTIINTPDTLKQLLYKKLYKTSTTKTIMDIELVYNPIQLHEIGLFMTYVNTALRREASSEGFDMNLKTLNEVFQNALAYMNHVSTLKPSENKEDVEQRTFALHTSLFINPESNSYLFELIPLVFPQLIEPTKLKQEFLSEFVNFMCEEIGGLVQAGVKE